MHAWTSCLRSRERPGSMHAHGSTQMCSNRRLWPPAIAQDRHSKNASSVKCDTYQHQIATPQQPYQLSQAVRDEHADSGQRAAGTNWTIAGNESEEVATWKCYLYEGAESEYCTKSVSSQHMDHLISSEPRLLSCPAGRRASFMWSRSRRALPERPLSLLQQ
eukprot:4025480-Pleurochrysis_carterae.AAC.4